jgi:hypothetical protein
MKRVALVVVLLYAAALVALTWPLLRVCFWGESEDFSRTEIFGVGLYWAFIGVMVAGQALLLVVPVQAASRRPVPQRSVIWPILASGLMAGGLVLAAIAAVTELVQTSHAFDKAWQGWSALGVGAATWLVWSVLFHRASRGTNPEDVLARHCRLMIQGSILEFLVAVPTHIVARQRNYCCAGVYTFTGIAVGTAVMLLAYGPAVFVLVANRWRKLHPISASR